VKAPTAPWLLGALGFVVMLASHWLPGPRIETFDNGEVNIVFMPLGLAIMAAASWWQFKIENPDFDD